ncbi:TPA: hypothetical protein U1676_001534 [Streptococcus suis]|nr:hypothetical protein [Streptococcus suis]NQG74147.1 hypothetical protein [Streptococcus suis]HEM3068653.1 hypothetical protein [Streptococcus suis]HEM5566028.1 hypothetical protein [Streptococcus suis]
MADCEVEEEVKEERMDIYENVGLLIFMQLTAMYACIFMAYYQIQLIKEFSKHLKKEKRRRKSNNGRK